MKKFIILGWCGGMGGGHIYTRNQCVVARKLEWTPIVIHFSPKDPVIPDLEIFGNNRVRELRFPPCYYTSKEQKIILKRLKEIVNPQPGDSFFIESNDTCVAYWGELLAKELSCKNFSFLLEFFFRNKEDNLDFLEFKLKRKELAGIMENSLPDLFRTRFQLTREENKRINAFCTNSVEDIPIPFVFDTTGYDFVIGNIGRSTKPYVQWIGEDIAEFALKHPEKKILVVLVGGEPDSSAERKIESSLEKCDNVKVFSTGFLFPIPLGLLKKINVVTATSGCIRAAQEAQIITIAYKDNERNPYGVCGYDLKEVALPEQPINARRLDEYLEEIFFGDFLKKYQYSTYLTYVSDEERWRDLEADTMYMLTPTEEGYYNASKVYPKSKILKLWVRTIGNIYPLHYFMEFLERTGIVVKMHNMVCRIRGNSQKLPG